jgi:hypothetical protein
LAIEDEGERMIRTTSLTAVLAAIALATPALAQAPGPSGADPALREMQRERAAPTATPYVPAQNRNAADADISGVEQARALLAEARTFLVRRSTGRAVEALERAETRLLTNPVAATEADRPQSTAAVSQIRSARRLAGQGDTRAALNALDQAETALPATPTGPGARPLPDTVPTAVDAPTLPPHLQRPARPTREGPRPAVPQGPGIPAEATPPRG